MQETKLFLITYFAALVSVLPPGLVNMSVAKISVQRGKKDGLFVAVGASAVIFLQALIAVLLARYIFDNPYVRSILLRTGLVIFFLLAIYFFVMAQRKKKKIKVSEAKGTRSIFKGMLVAALNILPIPFFCAVGVALNVGGGDVDHHIFEILIFTIAASLGVFTSLYLYVLFFVRIEDKADYFSKYSNYFMAILMVILVVITFIRIFY